MHSNASDGRCSPSQLVQKAASIGLRYISLADHDTVDGIPEALAAATDFPQLMVIPCVEISTDTSSGEVHVLGYFLDYRDRELGEHLRKFRESRQNRAQRMVAKLADMGIKVDWGRVKEIAGQGAIGRPHIAQAMLEKGHISTIKEAFIHYIGQGGPAYVERDKMTPAEAVDLILRARGLPVLAHPFTIIEPETMIANLIPAGLAGIEAYYGNSTPEEVHRFVNLAKRHNLIVTGGSDYHGLDDASEKMMGSVAVPLQCVEDLIAMARKRNLVSI